ncbi:MAG: TrkH family potassium uptake protein [Clostridia bacterium]|nr:TrkH family potassium uptake protein [Clostridia bacterium]
MNRRMVFYLIGQMLKVEAALMALPLIVSLIYRESSYLAFLISIGIALGFGFLMTILSRPKTRVFYAKEGFVIVSLAWIAMSLIGAAPFVISGEIPSFIDAVFETISGFTTTGSSIVRNVEALSKGILFWRSFTHWIGGMGVLVFVLAIMPKFSDRSIHLIRAEMAGPIVGKLVPKAKDTAKILYLIYIAMTVIETIFLLFGGMSLFESVVHSFGTAGTGGFGIKADSIGGYSPYCQWVITVFMLLFGINFNLYYFLLLRNFRSIFKNLELWVYIGVITVSTGIITANILSRFGGFFDALRYAAFQVSSVVTTTGYATADFDLWPSLSKGIIFILLFLGGCAGSTAGGLKISRVLILFKMMRSELHKMLHPRSVNVVKMDGRQIDDPILRNVGVYFAIYIVGTLATFVVLSFEPFNFETNFSAAVTCINNVGPGFSLVGPSMNFAEYSDISKIVLSFAMLLGRLEIFPLLISLSPSTWSKK